MLLVELVSGYDFYGSVSPRREMCSFEDAAESACLATTIAELRLKSVI